MSWLSIGPSRLYSARQSVILVGMYTVVSDMICLMSVYMLMTQTSCECPTFYYYDDDEQ
jgi:uncharacterized membrane protein (GlpM family)